MVGTIPVVDLSEIKEVPSDVKDNKEWRQAAKEIRNGLGDIGFIYLKNHGVEESVITKLFEQSKTFFDLPTATKRKYKQNVIQNFSTDSINYFAGYAEPGDESLQPDSAFELRETFDYVQSVANYPDAEVPELKTSFDDLHTHMKTLATKMLILLALSLELDDPEYFLCRFTWIKDDLLPKPASIRTIFYPPIPSTQDIPPNTVRCGEHSDYGMMTLLLQDAMGGLEVKTVDGEWVPATPIPGTILVNTGDLLEFWSAGVFPATPHRVLIPEDKDIQRKPRFSTAWFSSPNVDTLVAPLKIKKNENEVKRLALGNTPVNYDEMEPVISMEYVTNRIKISYVNRIQKK